MIKFGCWRRTPRRELRRRSRRRDGTTPPSQMYTTRKQQLLPTHDKEPDFVAGLGRGRRWRGVLFVWPGQDEGRWVTQHQGWNVALDPKIGGYARVLFYCKSHILQMLYLLLLLTDISILPLVLFLNKSVDLRKKNFWSMMNEVSHKISCNPLLFLNNLFKLLSHVELKYKSSNWNSQGLS